MTARIVDGYSTSASGLLSDIISGSTAAPSVDMATTRIPCFDQHMQHPSNGFRKLIELSRIHIGESRPSTGSMQHEFNPAWDVIAMQTDSSQDCVKDFKDNWGAIGINFERHFFLIFIQWQPTIAGQSGVHRYSPITSSRASSNSPRRSAIHGSSTGTGMLIQPANFRQRNTNFSRAHSERSTSRSSSVDSGPTHSILGSAFNSQSSLPDTAEVHFNSGWNSAYLSGNSSRADTSTVYLSNNTVSLNSPPHSHQGI